MGLPVLIATASLDLRLWFGGRAATNGGGLTVVFVCAVVQATHQAVADGKLACSIVKNVSWRY